MPERLLPSYATRCPGWIGAGRRLGWVVLLATSVVGLLEASPTHAQDMAQVCQPLGVASASQIRLDVHDFISDAAGGLLPEELILQDAIADVLFLHFLVQPRLDVRRVPLLFRSTSQSAGIGQQAPQIEISGEGSRYVLEGKITFLQPLRSGQPGVPGPGKAKLLSLRYQLWEWTSPRKATIKLEGGVLVTRNELHERLQDVAMEVIAHLLPNRKVCLVIGPFRLDRKSVV